MFLFFFNNEYINYFIYIVSNILILIPLLVSVAYLTLVERKVIGSMQRRKGPNVVGIFGLLQPLADGVKLLFKETILPSNSNKFIFIIAPMLSFFLSLLCWCVIPFGKGFVFSDIDVGILFIFAISSLNVYGVIMAGWSSNSKYAFLGALRSAAQMISYEVSIGLIIISILIIVGSLNLTEIVESQNGNWYIFSMFPAFIMFFISALAETNRPPFDLPEAEAELVAGYNVEYSSITFALFFLAEYSYIILMSVLISILFFGGWLPIVMLKYLMIPDFIWIALKASFFAFLFIWVRATFPRYRYDQLMRLGWKIFLPLSLGWVVLASSIFIFVESLYKNYFLFYILFVDPFFFLF